MEHIPVFKNELINSLNINPNGVYIDCTLGGAGHSRLILNKLKNGYLISLDIDSYAINRAIKYKNSASKWKIVQDHFSNIKSIIEKEGYSVVDGIICDLGVSSFQLNDEQRGFSYHRNTNINFNFDLKGDSLKTLDFINNESQKKIEKVLKMYGDEKYSYQIAKNIIKGRQNKKITTTFDLVDIIKNCVPLKYKRTKHPARKTFQAIRIYINDEIKELEKLLKIVPDILKPNGRFLIISFHSIEDRIIKNHFKNLTFKEGNKIPIHNEDQCKFSLIWKKAQKPTKLEIIKNRRSRSAILRGIWKKNL